MLILPAIDLRGGQCVRLRQGDYAQETVFGDDPAAMARRWVEQGAEYLHLVDLDGARQGHPVNGDSVRRIVQAAGVPCQLGGGLRSEEHITEALGWGVERVILGTDAPAGSGVQPLGILRMVSMLSSLGDLPAELAFCLATGNTARMRALDCGLIEIGRAADFVIMDKAQHSPGRNILESVQLGDLPGVSMTVIDGIVRTQRSRNTPPADKVAEVVGQ